jgi:predicted DNA-binding transcriptional regulator YafY
MLTPEEVEAAVLGAQMVMARGRPGAAPRRRGPDRQDRRGDPGEPAPAGRRTLDPRLGQLAPVPDNIDMAGVRQAIRAGMKLVLTYRDEQERETRRTVWPFAVGYYETSRLIVAYCELRTDFRSFRTDRIAAAEFTETRYPDRPASLRARWRRRQDEMYAQMRRRA